MRWMFSIWLAVAFLPLCRGHNTLFEGYDLSTSGYHLCTGNETRHVSSLVTYKMPYTVRRPCGGWLPWKTCEVTLYRMIHRTEYKTVTEEVARCCDGFVQVSGYCALPLNRSREFTAKPGSCSNTEESLPNSQGCEWDIDCPGWQKCCQKSGAFLCSEPASSSHYSENGGWHFNLTVTVKADYQQLMSLDRGLLNHTRLLHAMVTGALDTSDITVHYLNSWPVHPFRTATSLLIGCNVTLSLSNTTSKLHLLLKHIEEVSSVLVEDVNECMHTALRACSPQAECVNTVGSYRCTCCQGHTDPHPSHSGANCEDDMSGTSEPPAPSTAVMTPTSASTPARNTTYTPTSQAAHEPIGNSTVGIFNSAVTSVPIAPSTTSFGHSYSSYTPQQTSTAPYTSVVSTAELQPSTCAPPHLADLQSSNVTGTSFCVYWSCPFQSNQTYLVVLGQGSEVISYWETNQTTWEVRGLQPGVLYNISVTPLACGDQGHSLHVCVKTDAETVEATARLTNILFTTDLLNSSSQAYLNLTRSIEAEIYQSLSPEMKAMVASGEVRIEITSLSEGSVVVNFTIILTPSQTQDIRNVSLALMSSLVNSSKYTLDENNIENSITDLDECDTGENDCSQSAVCNNVFASYTCFCLEGFTDIDPARPGRACQAMAITTPLETTTQPLTSTVFPVTSTPTTTSTTPAPTTTSTTPEPTTTSTSTTPAPTTTSTTPEPTTTSTSTTPAPTTTTSTTANPTTSIIPTTTSTTPDPTTTTSTSSDPTTTSTTPAPTTTTSTTSDPTTTSTTPAPTTTTSTTSDPTTTSTTSDPTTTSTTSDPTTTSTTPDPTTSTTPAPTTTTSTTSDPTTTSTTSDPTTSTTPAPTTTTSTTPTSTSTTPAPTTSTTNPDPTTTTPTTPTTTTPTTPTTTTPAPTTTTTTTALTTTITTPATTITTPATTATSQVAPEAISVQCRATAITVTIAKEFLRTKQISDNALYLGLEECGVNGGNATHTQLTVAWNECDTRLLHNDTYYTAHVTLHNTMDPQTLHNGTVEVPRIRLQVPIMCTYRKSILISTGYGPMGYGMIKDTIMGSGTFHVTVQLMNGTLPLPQNYSLSPEEDVVVVVSLNATTEQIKVVINKCWVTPSSNPTDAQSDTFLENSCPLPNTYSTVLENGNSSTSRLSIRIFSFVELDVIYLHCQVQICVEMGSASCVPDCVERTGRFSNTIGTAYVYSGPLHRSDLESLEEEFDDLRLVGFCFLGIGLTFIFLGGFICLFFYQRNRIGHYNFNLKPKQESFTYLVFNT